METAPQDGSVWSVFRNRWVKFLFLVICVAFVVWVVRALRGILLPFGLAVVVAYILDPVVELLQRVLRCRRLLAVLLLMGTLTVAVLGAAALGVYYTVRTVEKVVPAAQRALKRTGEPGGLWERIRLTIENVPNEIRVQIDQALEQLPTTVRQHIKTISTSILQGIGAVVRVLLGFVMASFNCVLFFVVSAYLLVDLPALREGTKDLLPARYKDGILRVLGAIDRDVHAFVRGQILVALALGAIYSVGLTISGVDFALLIGVVAGLANIVPYLGIAVGLVPALLFSLVPYHGLLAPIGVVATFIVGQSAEGFYLTPKIVGKNVGLHPVAVILAILVFGKIFGFLGVLFAVPLGAAVKVLLGELVRWYKSYQGTYPASTA